MVLPRAFFFSFVLAPLEEGTMERQRERERDRQQSVEMRVAVNEQAGVVAA